MNGNLLFDVPAYLLLQQRGRGWAPRFTHPGLSAVVNPLAGPAALSAPSASITGQHAALRNLRWRPVLPESGGCLQRSPKRFVLCRGEAILATAIQPTSPRPCSACAH